MAELYVKKTITSDRLLGTEFEAGPSGWCKHCGWAGFAHFIRASDSALLCLKPESPDSASVPQEIK